MVIKYSQKGVTVAEMIVVVAIVAVVSTVLVFNYSAFSTNVTLRGLSQDLGLTIRRAQAFATSVRALNSSGISSYPAYGIAFSAQSSASGALPYQKRFVLFADIPVGAASWGDGLYTSNGSCSSPDSSTNECAEIFNIASSDKIVRLCTDSGSTGETCFADKEVDIVFRRPSPDARICVVSGGVCSSQVPSYVKIVLQSAKGAEKTVVVWNTGQISAQ